MPHHTAPRIDFAVHCNPYVHPRAHSMLHYLLMHSSWGMLNIANPPAVHLAPRFPPPRRPHQVPPSSQTTPPGSRRIDTPVPSWWFSETLFAAGVTLEGFVENYPDWFSNMDTYKSFRKTCGKEAKRCGSFMHMHVLIVAKYCSVQVFPTDLVETWVQCSADGGRYTFDFDDTTTKYFLTSRPTERIAATWPPNDFADWAFVQGALVTDDHRCTTYAEQIKICNNRVGWHVAITAAEEGLQKMLQMIWHTGAVHDVRFRFRFLAYIPCCSYSYSL